MNILIVNKYYFISGGPERYLFTISSSLEKNGHNVFPFALKVNKNLYSEHSDYFLDSPFDGGVAQLGEARLTLIDKFRLVLRTIYSYRARKAIKEIICEKEIDVVYLLNICNYITPSVIDGAKELNVPVVMRLSDFNFICSSYHYMRDGQICMKCKGSTLNALRYRCVRGSLFQSLARVLAINAHRLSGVYKRVDAFVCPSRLMAKELEQFGMLENKVNYVPSFVDTQSFKSSMVDEEYALYYGRLSTEKGVDILIDAWQLLGEDAPHLRIVGSGDAELMLKQLVLEKGINTISFEPFLGEEEVKKIVDASSFVLVPSVCHDNAPMVVFEAMALGKAVIASSVGGIIDQVVDGETGILVPPGNAAAIAEAVQFLKNKPEHNLKMGVAARKRAEDVFGPEAHLAALNKIFNDIV